MTDLVHSGSASIPGGDEAAGATMLQKAARALAFSFVSDSGRGIHLTAAKYADHSWEQWVPQVRAALMAVREADDSVCAIGDYAQEGFVSGPGDARTAFTAMIDAILADGAKR